MKDEVYLVFNKGGIRRLIKKISNKVTLLQPGELMVKVNLEVEDKYFKFAIPEATVKLSQENVIMPEVKVEPVKTEQPKSIIDFIDTPGELPDIENKEE